MLELLRKYQRFFFFIITAVVIASFSFFGTYSALDNAPTQEDRVLGRAIDGSELRWLEIRALSQFLAADRDDLIPGATLNLLNDGVIRRDLIATGVASTVVETSFPLLKGDLEQKFQRIKTFRGYEHPQAPFLCSKAVWERFSPGINRGWSSLQMMEEASVDLFPQMASLYQAQSSFPMEWLRQILLMQEQQYKWLQPDPRLRQDDLSLFGFRTLTDWFGKDFVDLMAQFVHNAALIAEKKGVQVSYQEAKNDLKRIFSESMERVRQAKLPLQMTYREQLRMLGLDESEAAALWRKVLLFRRYFQEIGQAALVDRLPYSEFAAVATQKASVDVYQWDPALKTKTALDLLGFETYLKAVAPSSKSDSLKLPSSLLSVEEIQKKNSEFVGTLYTAKVSAIDKREAALRAPLKEVWDFEISDEAWKLLKKEFSFLQHLSANTPEERFQLLENLDAPRRTKVDLFARRQLIEKHPEWVQAALEAAPAEEKQLVLSAGKIHLPHVENPQHLGSLFEQILSSPETALVELQQFHSGDAVFRFENIAKISDPKIKTLREAKADGSLDLVVNRLLETEYPKRKSKLPSDLQSKELSDVKEELAMLLVESVRKTIQKQSGPAEQFAIWRLYAEASEAWKDLQINPHDSKWVRSSGEDPLLAQFKLERTEKQISRTTQENWMAKESFVLLPSQWSSVYVDPEEGVTFFYLKERSSSEEPILSQLSFGKEVLAADAQRVLAEQLIDNLLEKQAIVIPMQVSEVR